MHYFEGQLSSGLKYQGVINVWNNRSYGGKFRVKNLVKLKTVRLLLFQESLIIGMIFTKKNYLTKLDKLSEILSIHSSESTLVTE